MKKVWFALLVSTVMLAACGDNTEDASDLDGTEESSADGSDDAGDSADDSDTGADDVDETTDDSTNTDEEGSEGGGGGPPADSYACNINDAGFCIFTGTPHQTGLNPGTSDIVDRDGGFLFLLSGAVASNATGDVLTARGTPAFDGDELIESSHDGLSADEIAFHRVMATMYPIRNALMYDIAQLTQADWNALVGELALREVKETTFTDGATPRDNYYGRQGVFDLAKNPGGRDIHHDVMKFLEESGLYFLCHVTSDDFNQMLTDSHPEGHDACGEAGITTKIPF